MEIEIMGRATYVQQFGPVARRGSKVPAPEMLELWEKIKKLTVTDYLIIPIETGRDAKKFRVNISQSLVRMCRAYLANFRPCVILNAPAKHLVVWKEPKPDVSPRLGRSDGQGVRVPARV